MLTAILPAALLAASAFTAPMTSAPDASEAPPAMAADERLSSAEVGAHLSASNTLPPNCWFEYIKDVCVAVICDEGGVWVILPEPCSAFGG